MVAAFGSKTDDRNGREVGFRAWHPLPAHWRRLAAEQANSVLLETGRPDGDKDQSLLFLGCVEELQAFRAADIDDLLEAIRCHLAQGRYVAGYFNYECGEHLVGLRPAGAATGDEKPIAWLGVFEAPLRFEHRDGLVTGAVPAIQHASVTAASSNTFSSAELKIPPAAYREKIERIQQYIRDGDTYQVNFTDRVEGCFTGEPLSIYEELLAQQPVSFAAFMNRPAETTLSFSPELFFRIVGRQVTVRPMKGTWPRGFDLESDKQAALRLRGDEKNRSEHVMIVDLLRNDLGKVCQPGSVCAERLFEVEHYRTLLQMTSTIKGSLRDNTTALDVFRALFPSGSITGAPKRRTMEIIRQLELQVRGVYTGSIGYFAPNGDACFNVAIRTLVLRDGQFVLGVGGGITADSQAEDELHECELKSRFLTQRIPSFSLIETMRVEAKVVSLEEHMGRLAASAQYFGIRYEPACLTAEITQMALDCDDNPARMRVQLQQEGKWTIEISPLDERPWTGRLMLSKERTRSDDLFLQHKTTNRFLYEQELAGARRAGFDEVLFCNERGEVTEGAISNVFVKLSGSWATPPLSSGVLPGVRRQLLLQDMPTAHEAVVRCEDLQDAEAIFLCSSLRDIRSASSLTDSNGRLLWPGESRAD